MALIVTKWMIYFVVDMCTKNNDNKYNVKYLSKKIYYVTICLKKMCIEMGIKRYVQSRKCPPPSDD